MRKEKETRQILLLKALSGPQQSKPESVREKVELAANVTVEANQLAASSCQQLFHILTVLLCCTANISSLLLRTVRR